jgi:hypothetical protein
MGLRCGPGDVAFRRFRLTRDGSRLGGGRSSNISMAVSDSGSAIHLESRMIDAQYLKRRRSSFLSAN